MIERAVFEYLINSLWQVPLLACATWLLLRAARPSLNLQHLLWFATLLPAVLLPLRGIEFRHRPAVETSALIFDPAPKLFDQPSPTLASQVGTLLGLRVHPLQLTERTIDWLVGLYGVSVALSLARLLHSWIAARRLLAQAAEHPLTTLESTLLRACAQRLQLPADRQPQVRFLPGAASPMVVGIRRNVLLLPEDLRHGGNLAFNDRTVTAVLSHELAHIRRRDFLANLIARVVALPIAYHPATIALHRRIRQTREMICDDHAAGAFESSSTYARSLLALAERLVPQPSHVEAVSLFANAHNTLEERIMNLTEARLPISRTLRTVRIAAGAITLVAATAAAATLHVKPAEPSVVAVTMVQALAPPQVAAPAPGPAPAPSPVPSPKARHRTIVNGEQRELTPEEKAQLDKDLAQAKQQVDSAMAQFKNGEFQKNLAESMKSINSAEFKKQMADMQEQMKQFKSPEFRKQIADAQGFTNSPEWKREMDEMKQKFNSPEFQKQIEDARLLAMRSAAEWKASNVEAREQLDAAREAIAEARKQSSDAKVQQQLDEAQRRIEAATKKF